MVRNPLPRAQRRALASFLVISPFALHAALALGDGEAPPAMLWHA